MKKIYTAPEADLLCFEPQENLASIFEQLQGGNPGSAVGSFGDDSSVIRIPQT